MKTNTLSMLYPPRRAGSKLAALIATLLLLLAPASALADNGYYVTLSNDSKTLIFTVCDEESAGGALPLSDWLLSKNNNATAYSSVEKVIIDVSFVDAHLTSMAYLFSGLSELTTIEGFEYLYTDDVEDMSYMFKGCAKLKTLNLDAFNTAKVTNMNQMFNGCKELETLNLSTFNTANVTSMNSMFQNCAALTTITFGASFKTDNVKGMNSMFNGCKLLKNITFGDNFNTANVTDMANMFKNCEALTTLTFGEKFNTAKVMYMNLMFYYCTELTTISFGSNFKTTAVTNMGSMFEGCSKLSALDLSGFKTDKVTNMKGMFYGCQKLGSLDLSSFNTAKVKSMNSMFYGCTELTTISFGNNFKNSVVTDMGNMFRDCSNLSDLNLSGFKTDKVADMSNMFYGCSKLSDLDLSGFNTANVTNIRYMFGNCANLTSLNLGNNYFKGTVGLTTTAKEYAFSGINSDCKLTVGAGFDVSVLTADETSGKYKWNNGALTLHQLTLDEDNADKFAAAGNQEGGITYPKVVLKRSFNPEAWNTLVVPFDINATEAKTVFGGNVKIANYTSATQNTDGSYTLAFTSGESEAITANKPVFIYGVTTSTDNSYTFENRTVKTVTGDAPKTGDGSVQFVGTYVAGNVTQGDYFIDSDNKLWLATDNTNTIKATRATFRPANTSGAKTATFVIDGETTAINLPATIGTANGATYNLQGQRVGDDYKGVVIKNGRKYVRK